ncbi:MAG: hypothetical protein ABUL43_02570 [Hyphomicrobium sp.]
MAIDWLDPWYEVSDPAIREGLAKQLAQEVGTKHALYRVRLALIARRDDTDDALFLLEDGRVAEVHMTWRKTAEPDPRWPATAIFASLEDWARARMTPLHEELKNLR